MSNSYSWNNYVIRFGVILTIFSWIYMILYIRDVISDGPFLTVAFLSSFIGTPFLIGYWFVDMRNRKLRRLAKDFGLSFERLVFSGDSPDFPINRVKGKINGSDIQIEDHQRILTPFGMDGEIISRKTIFLINQVEQKVTLSWNGYMRVREIRRKLVTIRG